MYWGTETTFSTVLICPGIFLLSDSTGHLNEQLTFNVHYHMRRTLLVLKHTTSFNPRNLLRNKSYHHPHFTPEATEVQKNKDLNSISVTPESHTLNTLLLTSHMLRDHVTCPKIHRWLIKV